MKRAILTRFPAAPASLLLKTRWGDKHLEWKALADGKTARLEISPLPSGKPQKLDVAYQVAPSRGAFAGLGDGPFQASLRPPRLPGDPGLAPVRWQVTLPSGWVPLSAEGALAPEDRAMHLDG